MSNYFWPNGSAHIAWAEFKALDPDRASGFYSMLFDWKIAEPDDRATALLHPGTEWRVACLDGKAAAAFTPMFLDAPQGWLMYVSVADTDAAVDKIQRAGGRLISGPDDVAGVSRAAILADPAGAVFGVWQPPENLEVASAGQPGTLARCALATGDPRSAIRFYADVFGWEPASGQGEGTAQGGVAAQYAPSSRWIAFFTVADLDQTVRQTRRLGGSVCLSPDAAATDRAVVLTDPQGAVFGALPAGSLAVD